MRPLVSILFPCYNAAKYLSYSLESILNQDYTNLEIICINDGSSDNTSSLLKEYQTADTRIRVIHNPVNIGLIDSLNKGIDEVKGQFFARMDADDYCPPDRISRQIKFILAHPEFDLVSTGYYYFMENDRKMDYVPPVGTTPCALKYISLFSTPLTHASVLGRSRVLQNNLYRYDKNFPHSEDYELFSRLAWQGISVANLNERLYWVRLNAESVSALFNDQQIRSHLEITKRNIRQHLLPGADLSETDIKVISNRINQPLTKTDLKKGIQLLNDCFQKIIRECNCSENDKKELRKYLRLHTLNILIQSNKVGFKLKKAGNLGFFVRSLQFFKPTFTGTLFKKIFIYFKHRSI